MKFDFLINDRHLGDRTIPVTVSCYTKIREISIFRNWDWLVWRKVQHATCDNWLSNFMFHLPFYAYIIPIFSSKLYLKGPCHIWYFKFHWRSWADKVSEQDKSALLSAKSESSARSSSRENAHFGSLNHRTKRPYCWSCFIQRRNAPCCFASRKMTKTL